MGEDARLESQHQADAGVGTVSCSGCEGTQRRLCPLKPGLLDDVILRKQDVPMNYRMAKALVFTKIRNSLGLDNCHSFFSGTAPLSQDFLEFFLSLDIPIGEIYGLSECSGPHSVSSNNSYKILRYQSAAASRTPSVMA